MDVRYIEIPPITLEWTEWYTWNRFELDARSDSNGITPPNLPGVYEARLAGSDKRLTIGKTSNLRRRLKQGLVKGKVRHSSGKDITRLLHLKK